MADNPYRFTVKVMLDPANALNRWWLEVWRITSTDPDCGDMWFERGFPTEAEANEHADMILTALQGATRD